MDEIELAELQQDHLDLQQGAMGVLLGWSAVNLAAGPVGFALADSPRADAFWLGNAGWNVVNLAIAAPALASIPASRRAVLDEAGLRRKVDNFERALLFNAGLDLAYIAAGGWLGERGRRRGDDRERGLGEALIVQGAFLFAFDAAVYAASSRQTRALRR